MKTYAQASDGAAREPLPVCLLSPCFIREESTLAAN